MPKIEEAGKSWLRRPKLYKGVVEPYKKRKKKYICRRILVFRWNMLPLVSSLKCWV